MTAIKNEHNRAKTQWVFEPVSVVAGVFFKRLVILMLNNFANIKKNQFDKFFFEQLDGDYFWNRYVKEMP